MKNNALNFLGRGNAFNYNEDNTSAYFIHDNHFYLFDCGQKIATKIIHFKLLNNIKRVTIFITHLHPDHVASLAELITYINLFYKDITYEVIYKNKNELIELLEIFNCNFYVDILDNYQDDYLKVEIVNQSHIPNSYGYLVYANDVKFFYSGDTNEVNAHALELLLKGELDVFYHEVSKKQSLFHVGIETLNKLIPSRLRNKVVLMHFEDEEIINLSLKSGYEIAKVNL